MSVLKSSLIFMLKGYQKLISPFIYNNCRYYPSCSHYAFWLLKNENTFRAIFAILYRILRCNPLFIGGIEYPVIHKNIAKSTLQKQKLIKPDFWLIPLKDKKFYLIKNFKDNLSV